MVTQTSSWVASFFQTYQEKAIKDTARLRLICHSGTALPARTTGKGQDHASMPEPSQG